MATLEALVITALLTLGSTGVFGNSRELSTTAGDTVHIPCLFGEGTIRNIYWYYNDGTGPIKILTFFKGTVTVDAIYAYRATLHDDNSTLILSGITVNDEGTYRCDVDREGQTAVPNINTKLNIFSLTPDTLPEIAECRPTDVDCIIYSNKSITITCALRNVYPVEDVKLIWYQDGQLVTSPNDLTLNDDGTIDLIRPIQVSESGNLTCNASFLTTQGAKNTTVSVGVRITSDPDVQVTPEMRLPKGGIAGIVVAVVFTSACLVIIIFHKKLCKMTCHRNSQEYPANKEGHSLQEEDSNCEQGTNQDKVIPSGSKEPNFDNILETVAKKIQWEDIQKLGKALGFDNAEIRRYIATNSLFQEITFQGTLNMLQDWNKRQIVAKERKLLKDALIKAGLNHLADEIFNISGTSELSTHENNENSSLLRPSGERHSPTQGSNGNTKQDRGTSKQSTDGDDESSSLLGPSGTESSSDQRMFNDLLLALAKRIPYYSVGELGNKLGFDSSQVERYIVQNSQGGNFQGTLAMLQDWNKEQTKATEQTKLKEALIEAELSRLSDDFFPADGGDGSNKNGSGERKITDEEILILSKKLPVQSYNALCIALGFDHSSFSGILSKHHSDDVLAYQEILQRWNMKTIGRIKHLDEALVKAELGGLISQYKKK